MKAVQMNQQLVDKIVQAVLYEGYILYPYRPSVKNHQRWTFGGLYPRAYSEAQPTGDAWSLQTECIVVGSATTTLETRARFLHLTDRKIGQLLHAISRLSPDEEPEFRPVTTLSVNGKQYHAWQEAMERETAVPAASIGELLAESQRLHFAFGSSRNIEPLADSDGKIAGILIREQQEIEGSVEISAAAVADGVFKITVRISNRTDIATESDDVMVPRIEHGQDARATMMTRDDALMRSLVSTHAILQIRGGEFVSMTYPPDDLHNAASGCVNYGVWPVLVGEAGERDTMLASPIILYDYPRIAPESPGDLFDGTEIDEILTLRVLTLTDDEKRDVASVDERAGEMLKRTEALAREQLMGLHGTMRGLRPVAESASQSLPSGDVFPAWDVLENKQKLPSFCAGGVELHPGDRVRLHPRGGADAFDMLLAGKTATIAAIEQDYEDRIHLAVTVEDDPGADFGAQGKPGHRFFFRPDEVERI
jgi:hypothetical protein